MFTNKTQTRGWTWGHGRSKTRSTLYGPQDLREEIPQVERGSGGKIREIKGSEEL